MGLHSKKPSIEMKDIKRKFNPASSNQARCKCMPCNALSMNSTQEVFYSPYEACKVIIKAFQVVSTDYIVPLSVPSELFYWSALTDFVVGDILVPTLVLQILVRNQSKLLQADLLSPQLTCILRWRLDHLQQ